ncbi:MAG TPA: hypothetical protein VGL80_23270 [Pseudonocardiaceae bacterium]|jgi:23S rRNA A2030 N6-methylase RlmJ
MANRHFGKLADVWKHGALLEVLDRERPTRYAETHAGSAAYSLVADDERSFGVLKFLSADHPKLSGSRYRAALAPFTDVEPPRYPGSAMLAMSVLGDDSSYLLCDIDPVSAAELREHAAGLSHCEVAEHDGMAATAAWLGGDTVVHIDPFDPHAHVPGGYSALTLAAHVAEQGQRLVYWYGYDRPDQQAWAYDALAELTKTPLWCGDILVVDADGAGQPGDLGRATTPGTGSGVVLANVDAATVSACAEFGHALADAYAGATLPAGGTGGIVFSESA